jgi:hypothetical protein
MPTRRSYVVDHVRGQPPLLPMADVVADPGLTRPQLTGRAGLGSDRSGRLEAPGRDHPGVVMCSRAMVAMVLSFASIGRPYRCKPGGRCGRTSAGAAAANGIVLLTLASAQ